MRLPAAEPEPSIIRSTLRALLHPRRLIPIVLVSASLVAAQASYSYDPLAIPLGIAMCVAFVIVAPVSWRVLFPDRIDLGHGGVRLLLYGAIGAGVVWSIGIVAPRVAGDGPDAADCAGRRGRVAGAVPGRRVRPRARHLDGGTPRARRSAGDRARPRGRPRATAGAAFAPRPALPVQHAERDRRVVPRGRRDSRARGRAAVRHAAHRAGRCARRDVAAAPRSWRCSTRCSSCIACAIPTACG